MENSDSNKIKPNVWLSNNDPIPFMLDVAGKMHIGDKELILAHILSAHSIGLSDKADPIHIYTVGKSGKGKGHTANTVLKLFPKEMTVPLASFSSKAFFYAKEEKLQNKIIHCPEVTVKNNDEEKVGLLRILTDSPSNNSEAEHWTVDDKRQHQTLKIKGRHVFWFNSVTPIEDDQVKNRVILGNPDETKEQDDKVFEQQQQIYGLLQSPVKESEFEYCRELNRLLLDEEAVDVFIPFTRFIGYPSTANRRLYPIFLTLIKSATKIRANLRQEITLVEDGTERKALLATPEDVETGIWVFKKLYPLTATQVSKQALILLDLMPDITKPGVTKEGLADLSGNSADWCYRKCKELVAADLVRVNQESRQFFYWKENGEGNRSISKIRVEWGKIGEKELTEAFSTISVLNKDKEGIEQFCKQHALFQNIKPSWMSSEEKEKGTENPPSILETEIQPSFPEQTMLGQPEFSKIEPEVNYV